MNNPWEEIELDDYENHMKLDSVMQLQAMNEMMKDQFHRYPVSSAIILGIAGGNGLCHITPETFEHVYGVDINASYLEKCIERYPSLNGVFHPIKADLVNEAHILPRADLVIANLLIEYIGYGALKRILSVCKPTYLSSIIQINTGIDFISDSPYLHVFDDVSEVHHQISGNELTQNLETIGYHFIFKSEKALPNDKRLVRMDYKLE